MLRILPVLIVACGAVSMSAAQPADGNWEVRLPHTAGKKCNEDALFRFNVAQGQLSGAFVGPRGTQPLRELVLNPDGSFSGETAGGAAAAGDPKHIISFAGKFSGSTVSLRAIDTMGCGTRTGRGILTRG